jgi:hypothetical protein
MNKGEMKDKISFGKEGFSLELCLREYEHLFTLAVCAGLGVLILIYCPQQELIAGVIWGIGITRCSDHYILHNTKKALEDEKKRNHKLERRQARNIRLWMEAKAIERNNQASKEVFVAEANYE